jgi:hypothetical protein
MDERDLQLAVYKIKNFNTQKMAEILQCSDDMVRKIKRGSSGLSNSNALLLQKKLLLLPEAFEHIRFEYKKKGKK